MGEIEHARTLGRLSVLGDGWSDGEKSEKNSSRRRFQEYCKGGDPETQRSPKKASEEIVYLSFEGIQEILKQVLEESGEAAFIKERPRILHPNLLEAVLDLPTQGMYGIELYQTIWKKAAVYLREIILLHICEGACKRTAFLATSTFLKYNGYILEAEDEIADDFCVSVADECLSIDVVAEWLKKHSIRKN